MQEYKLFVFQAEIGIKGKMQLNVRNDCFELILGSRRVYINPETICPGRSVVVLFSTVTKKMFTHYGFQEMCDALDATPSEFAKATGIKTLARMGKLTNGEVHVCCYLPQGQTALASSTEKFDPEEVLTKGCIEPFDWQYEPSVDVLRMWTEDKNLFVELEYCPAVEVVYDNPVLNYAGQYIPLHEGKGIYMFTLVPGEAMFVGQPYRRSKGMMINVEEGLRCSSLE